MAGRWAAGSAGSTEGGPLLRDTTHARLAVPAKPAHRRRTQACGRPACLSRARGPCRGRRGVAHLLQARNGGLVNHGVDELQVGAAVVQQVAAAVANIVLGALHVVCGAGTAGAAGAQRGRGLCMAAFAESVRRQRQLNVSHARLWQLSRDQLAAGLAHPCLRACPMPPHPDVRAALPGLAPTPQHTHTHTHETHPAGRRRPSLARSSRTRPSGARCGCSRRGRWGLRAGVGRQVVWGGKGPRALWAEPLVTAVPASMHSWVANRFGWQAQGVASLRHQQPADGAHGANSTGTCVHVRQPVLQCQQLAAARARRPGTWHERTVAPQSDARRQCAHLRTLRGTSRAPSVADPESGGRPGRARSPKV